MTLFLSRNTKLEVKVAIQGMVGAKIMENCEKYLGLPISKVNTFKDLGKKIIRRVMGWKEKYISKARREILIKTVAQAIPTYTMGLFKIPKALCDTINSTLAKYWWGQTKDEKKIHWINWKKLCTPKKKGDIGFRDIQAFNLALLAKQAWQLIQDKHSLFYRVYKSRYFPTCTFMETKLSNNPSYVWRSLLAARDLIREGSIWQVGDGRTIEVSTHKWLSHKPVFIGEPRPNLMVSEIIDENSRQWDREKLFDLVAYCTRMEIMAIPLSQVAGRDKLNWKENKGKVFSVGQGCPRRNKWDKRAHK